MALRASEIPPQKLVIPALGTDVPLALSVTCWFQMVHARLKSLATIAALKVLMNACSSGSCQ